MGIKRQILKDNDLIYDSCTLYIVSAGNAHYILKELKLKLLALVTCSNPSDSDNKSVDQRHK